MAVAGRACETGAPKTKVDTISSTIHAEELSMAMYMFAECCQVDTKVAKCVTTLEAQGNKGLPKALNDRRQVNMFSLSTEFLYVSIRPSCPSKVLISVSFKQEAIASRLEEFKKDTFFHR